MPRSAKRSQRRDDLVPAVWPADPLPIVPSDRGATPTQHRSGGGEQLPAALAGFPLHCPGVHLTNLQRDYPTAAAGVFAHCPVLHRQSLLIIRGNARIQTRTKHFWRFSSLAKNVSRFSFFRSPFSGHFGMSLYHGRRRSFSARQGSFYYAAVGAASRAIVSRKFQGIHSDGFCFNSSGCRSNAVRYSNALTSLSSQV